MRSRKLVSKDGNPMICYLSVLASFVASFASGFGCSTQNVQKQGDSGMNQLETSQPHEDAITSDRLDLDLLDKHAEKIEILGEDIQEYTWTYTEDDIETELFGNTKTGFVVSQTPPKPSFFKIHKEYYPNGRLKLKGKRMGGGTTMVGDWEYYHKNGELISKKNEDMKFGKFGYGELLLFLHQQGHINIETGENREGPHFSYEAESKRWRVSTNSIKGPNHCWMTYYVIDGETGEVIEKKEAQGGYE